MLSDRMRALIDGAVDAKLSGDAQRALVRAVFDDAKPK